MAENEQLVAVETLQPFLAELFQKTGMAEASADHCASALVQTNLWGIDSHGVLRAPVYLNRVRTGAVNPTPDIKPVNGLGALVVLDGDDGMGFEVGRTAMEYAVDLAKEHGVAAVGVVRSNHFGAAGLYTDIAVKQGMIGIAMTNVGPNMVAPGGSKPITGNNPLAISVPTFGEFPFMLDISLSNAAGGKLLLASKKGVKIPTDWATDKAGRPTDDPDEAFAGFLLPVGAYKGLGLSYVVDILSGLITGGAYQFGIKSMYKQPNDPSLTGHFMIAINPLALMSHDEMQARMVDFHQIIKESPMWDDSKAMLLPGELEYRTAIARRENGIPIPIKLVEELSALADEVGVATPFA